MADQPGREATEVARESGIHPGQIYNWRTQFNKLSKAQCRANEYQQTLEDLGIEASMSRKGNCRDNAVMEAFFARLKVEPVYPENYRDIHALRSGLFEYIEIFYNRQRLRPSIDYVDPARCELQSEAMNASNTCG